MTAITGVVENATTESLRKIGVVEPLRQKFIDFCLSVEEEINIPDTSVRDTVTGPLVDALHADVDSVYKTLNSGLVFGMKYRSVIARDFAMSAEPQPDHVWEPQTTRLLLHLAKEAKHILIGGAYCGDHAVLAAHQIQSHGGICHAFEPGAEQYEMLEQNMQANGLTNAELFRLGLWEDERTVLRLQGSDSHAHSEVASEETDSDTFGTVCIDGYGKRANIESLDVIMLDLEGGELSALRGAFEYLSRPVAEAPVIIFEIHRHYADWSDGLVKTDLLQYLIDLGYYCYAVRDYHSNVATAGTPIELILPEYTYLEGPPHGFNMLAVKDPSIVEDDMFRIVKAVSPKLLPHKRALVHHPIYKS